ncbi:acetyl-CoA acetyltransferase [Variovorax sp. WS11]|uniref:thiolase family protein n=1 Tax=Variovorax sp. WS11 TaxID=1105204 RepID=UPI000D0E080B|nr:thiolase family protein [Variovorax sp. WS11]NDZ12765.1 thiolase family protein [Variovorax sp. WS11]PSL84701.1 acetyl-CoA acetyltransferase [Variovorax sp. WS11]
MTRTGRGSAPDASIVGVGEIKSLRRTTNETTLGQIALASRLALLDAGLGPEAIDGLLVGPQLGETPMHVPATVAEYLGLRLRMANVVDLGGASAAGMIWRASAAIASGMCEAVLCVLGNIRPPALAKNRNPIREFDVPFGASGANITYAMIAQAHVDRYGTSAEDMAEIAVRARQNAQLNPDSIFYGHPISIEDVLASPMVSEPLHKLDITMSTAGGGAVVVVSPERARKMGVPSARFLGAGECITHRALSQAPEYTTGPLRQAMADSLKQAGVRANDLGLLSLYDCYGIVVGITLEDLGVCRPGEFGRWTRDHDFSHTGDVPLNTHGGQLGAGQADLAGGMSHVIEAVRQLRGDAGTRQISDPRIALVTGNGATLSEAVALVLGSTT